MINETSLNGNRAGNQFFIAAVTLSLLLHLAVLWMGRNFSFSADLASANRSFAPLEVVIAAVAQHKRASPAPQLTSSRAVITKRPVEVVAQTESTTLPEERTTVAESVAPTEQASQADDVLSSPEVPSSSLQVSDSQAATESRNHYLAAVLRCIESHKFYPEPARRRGLQGSVEVSFWLDARGTLTELLVKGRNPLLEKAAREAVINAIPLPPAPSVEGFPMQVRYEMVFRLQ